MVQQSGDLGGVQVGGVRHGSGVVAVVPVFDDWVKEVCEHLSGAADTLGEVKAVKKDGWPHMAGEIISTLFARIKNSYCLLFDAIFFIKHKIRSVLWELQKSHARGIWMFLMPHNIFYCTDSYPGGFI